MSLFQEDKTSNLLPKGWNGKLLREVLASKEADQYFELVNAKYFMGK